MSKLTDLEICKRIAEIDGTAVHEHKSVLSGFVLLNSESYETYNPLTDDSLCFKLMVNHYIEIGLYGTWYGCFKGDKPKGSDGCLSYELNINKAICLAIIEAHK